MVGGFKALLNHFEAALIGQRFQVARPALAVRLLRPDEHLRPDQIHAAAAGYTQPKLTQAMRMTPPVGQGAALQKAMGQMDAMLAVLQLPPPTQQQHVDQVRAPAVQLALRKLAAARNKP